MVNQVVDAVATARDAGLDQPEAAPGVHLTFRNAGGSVQHYYHFLFGLLVPLVRIWNLVATSGGTGAVAVRSCAILDQLLRQLRLPGLVIMDPAEHADLRANQAAGRGWQYFTIKGYDCPTRYDAKLFESVRDQLFFRFSAEIREEQRDLARHFSGSGPRIVIVRRLPPDPFYATAECEIKGAGASRRSIANIDALCSAAARDGGNVLATSLEGRSLYYQMALFAAADILVCQHGAALANLLWARKGVHVIEIIPRQLRDSIDAFDYFGDLARCLSLEYERIWQESPHGPVPVAELSQRLRRILAGSAPAALPLHPFGVPPRSLLMSLSWHGRKWTRIIRRRLRRRLLGE